MINFDKEILENTVKKNKIVIIEFWAPWCVPCRIMAPIIEDLDKEFKDNIEVVVGKINVDEESDLATIFKIRSIPTLVLIKNEEIKSVIAGVHPRHVYAEKINNLLRKQ